MTINTTSVSLAAILLTPMLIALNDSAIAATAKQGPVPSTQQTSTPNKTVASAPLSRQEILTHLLEAEMALQRNMFDVALDNYLLVAEQTRDPEAAQMATEIAIELQDLNKSLRAAKIWANAAPNDLQAQLVALALYVNSDERQAAVFLQDAIALQDKDFDQHLLLIMSQSSEQGQKNLTGLIYQAADQQQKNATLQLAAAQVAAALVDIKHANQYVDVALNLQPNLTGAIELKAKLIRYDASNDATALAYLEKQVNKYPKDGELRMFYISALLDGEQVAKAMPQLQTLSKDKELGGEALIMLGEVAVDKNDYKTASKNFAKAEQFPLSADKARFYSGQMAEFDNKSDAAITWYEKVSADSEFHTAAYLRAAYLYSLAGNYSSALETLQNTTPGSFEDQKQVLLTEIDILIDSDDLDKALDNSNRLLTVLPNDIDFLYARSVVLSLMKRSKEAERDLRSILQIDPDNALALNALGFTLANQPNRATEAMPFLEKALALNPDNPAIMDSMGWALYKLGRNDEAIKMLNQAYEMTGDSEIAAHLGEVLWSTGNKEAAKKIWSKALANSTDTKLLQETLNRLNVPVAEVAPSKKQTTSKLPAR